MGESIIIGRGTLTEADTSTVFRPNESSPFEETDTDQGDKDLVGSMESLSIIQKDVSIGSCVISLGYHF